MGTAREQRQMADPVPIRRGISRAECLGFLTLVVVLAWPFGVFDRFPFDDEVGTLDIIARYSPSELLVTPHEVHPPIFYLIFQLLAHFGFPLWAMRLASLSMSGIAFLFILDLTLAMVPEEKIVRLVTIFLFLSFPLFYGVGDALRWYPAFAVLVAGFFWLELRRTRPTMMGGMLLGLAASTNFLAIIPYLAFAAQRYLWRRSFEIQVRRPISRCFGNLRGTRIDSVRSDWTGAVRIFTDRHAAWHRYRHRTRRTWFFWRLPGWAGGHCSRDSLSRPSCIFARQLGAARAPQYYLKRYQRSGAKSVHHFCSDGRALWPLFACDQL